MENEDGIMIEDEAIAVEDIVEGGEQDYDAEGIIPFIMSKYKKSEDFRQNDEQRWLKAYKNYRGLYGSDVQFTEAEKSRVFIKVTKTKTLAAYGQIVEVLFAGNKFPLTVEPTELPEGVVEDVNFDPKKPDNIKQEPDVSPYGFSGDGKDLPAGATEKSLMDSLGPLSEKLKDIEGLEQGAGKTPTAITFSPAMVAAKRCRKKYTISYKSQELTNIYVTQHLKCLCLVLVL